MPRRVRPILILGLLVMCVSCQSLNIDLPTVTPTTPPNWWTVWLVEPVCKPPCWQNITPGITTFDEAKLIVEGMPDIRVDFQSKLGMTWKFVQNEKVSGNLTISPDGIVRMIWLGSQSGQKLSVKDVAASYGYPDYIKPYDCREGMCSTALLYPDVGMFLSVFIENTGGSEDAPQINISSDTVVTRVYFIEPGKESFLKLYQYKETELLMDWHGYGDYP